MVRANPNLTEADNKPLHAQGVRGIRFNLRPELDGKFDKDEMLLIVSRDPRPAVVRCDFHIEADLIVANMPS